MNPLNIEQLAWQKGDGLLPAIVQDADSGQVLMLAYLNKESLKKTLDTGLVTFFSRSRKQLWTKGETSGNTLAFVSIAVDCDADTALIMARPKGPVCHLGTQTCFKGSPPAPSSESPKNIDFLEQLTDVVNDRFSQPNPQASYVGSLIARGLDRMAQKVGEEAVETVIASKNADLETFESEAADLLFHLMVLLRAKNSSLSAVSKILKDRHKT